MASTNKTTNYELSQFLGTDKPAWLSDYNSDMAKIDAGMKTNADGVTSVDGKADTNTTNIGTLTNLTTDVKTNLVNAVNEVDGHADTAQNTANNANTLANTAKNTVDNLSAYLAMTNTATVSANNITISAGSINSKNINYATNNTGSLGKLYGWLYGVNITGATTITISGLPFNVTEEFDVLGAIFAQDTSSKTLYYPAIHFNTNNTATISFGSTYAGINLNLYLSAVVLFIQNFGDSE